MAPETLHPKLLNTRKAIEKAISIVLEKLKSGKTADAPIVS